MEAYWMLCFTSKPFFRVLLKHPVLFVILVCVVFGLIAYKAWHSAVVADIQGYYSD